MELNSAGQRRRHPRSAHKEITGFARVLLRHHAQGSRARPTAERTVGPARMIVASLTSLKPPTFRNGAMEYRLRTVSMAGISGSELIPADGQDCRYCWMHVQRSPAKPCCSIDACHERNSSTVSV